MPVEPTRTGEPSEPVVEGSPSASAPAAPQDDPCRVNLVGSDDGGRTWSVRTRDIDHFGLGVPAPGVLTTGTHSITSAYHEPKRISVDGGRTWRTVTVTDIAVPRVPAGGFGVASAEVGGGRGRLMAVDPRTAQAAPLANQPRLDVGEVNSIPDKSVLVVATQMYPFGLARRSDPVKFAVSRDNGASWSPVRTAPKNVGLLPNEAFGQNEVLDQIVTRDGINFYVICPSTSAHRLQVLVSRDSGATWTRTTVRAKGADGYVTRDGVHIVLATDRRGTTPLAGRASGEPSYRLTTRVRGLPSGADAYPDVRTAAGGYVAEVSLPAWPDGSHYYRSTDGWNWEPVTVR